MRKDAAGTVTQDYTRHGTTTLFRRLENLDGTVISRANATPHTAEWLQLLRLIHRKGRPGTASCT